MRKTKETRYAELQPSGVSDLTLVGWPVRFNEPTTINLEDGSSFTEIIDPHALDHCDVGDSTLTINHDDTRIPLARTGKTMRLDVTAEGLHMVASLAGDSPQAREAYSAVQRGDLAGMSFAFVVAEGGSSYDPTTNTRTITDIAKIYECSICAHPAYPTASIEARDEITAQRDAMRAQVVAKARRVLALAKGVTITER